MQYDRDKLAQAADAFTRLLIGDAKIAVSQLSRIGPLAAPYMSPAEYNKLYAELCVSIRDAAAKHLDDPQG